MPNSNQNFSEEKEHTPYLVAQPVPKSVRIASWLIILLGLLWFAYVIFVAFLVIVVGEDFLCGLCWLPMFFLVSWYIYNCGKRMQSGYYGFIYGYSAIGLAVLLLSAFMCIKTASITAAAIMLGIIMVFFVIPIVVAFLNRKRML